MSDFESWFKTILAAKLTPSANSMIVATIPTVTSGRLYLNNSAQEERISFTGRSGNTITGLTRWLSKTAVPATAWTWLSWIAWTEVQLVEMHDQMASTTGDNTFTGNNTYTGSNTHTNIDTWTWANAWVILTWAKKWFGFPSLTTAERLALTPVNGYVVYDSTIWVHYQYVSWGWTDFANGAVVNASETVAWKVQVATTAQTLAGTNTGSTGALLVSHPSDIRQITTIWFGDSRDWDVTITTTITLSWDKFYNNLTINSPWILVTNWYKFHVKWTLSWNGTIQFNGNNWWNWAPASSWGANAGWAGGAIVNAWTLNCWIAWVVGAQWNLWSWGFNGWGWISSSPSYSNISWTSGGNGWNWWNWSILSGWTGGTGWTSTQWPYYNKVLSLSDMLALVINPASTNSLLTWLRWTTTQYTVIASWGSWASWWGYPGCYWASWWGSGSSAGLIRCAANTVNFSWTWQAVGGNGGNGWNATYQQAGWWWWWAGGSGGIIYLIYHTLISLWATTLTGGTGGNGWTGAWVHWTAGTNGSTGATGTTIQIQI